jgi:hypothetical protein
MKLENEKLSLMRWTNWEPYKWYEALRWIEKKRENLSTPFLKKLS